MGSGTTIGVAGACVASAVGSAVAATVGEGVGGGGTGGSVVGLGVGSGVGGSGVTGDGVGSSTSPQMNDWAADPGPSATDRSAELSSPGTTRSKL